MKKVLLISAIAAVTLAFVGFCGAVAWINSGHGRRWIQARVNDAIPGSVSIGFHRLSLLPPRLDLQETVLVDPAGSPVAGFSRLKILTSWFSLLKQEIRLEEIRLEAPWVRLEGDPAGGTNLTQSLVAGTRSQTPEPTATTGSGWPMNIVAESIRLTQGRFAFLSADNTTRLEASGIQLAASGDLLKRSGNLDLEVARFVFEDAGLAPVPIRLTATLRLDGDALNLTTLKVTSDQLQMDLSGSVENLHSAPAVDGELFVDGQLALIGTLLQQPDTYDGRLEAKLSVNGAPTNPDARLDLTLNGGRLAGQPLDRGELSISLKDRQATIETAVIQLADGTVKAVGHMNLREAFAKGFLSPPSDLNAIAYDLDLAIDVPDIGPWLTHRADLSGNVSGRLALSGQGVTPEAMAVGVTLDAAGRDLLTPEMDRSVHPDIRLALQMADATIDVTRLEIAEPGMAITGKGRYGMESQSVSAHLSAAVEDLARIMKVAGGPSITGSCNLELDLDGTLPRPQVRMNLVSTDLTAGPVTIGNLSAEADLDEDGRLDLSAIDIQNQDARIYGTGSVRLLREGAGLDSAFDNHIELTAERLTASDFLASPPIDGRIDSRLTVSGPLTSLQGTLAVDAGGLTMDSTTIGDAAARVHLDAGTLHIDQLQWNHQGSTATVQGSIRLLMPGTLNRLADPPFDLAIDADHFDPGAFSDQIRGAFSLHGQAGGTLSEPVGRMALKGSAVELSGQSLEAVSLDARFDAGRLWVDRLLVDMAPGETIAGNGWLAFDKTIDLRIQSDGVSAKRIRQLADRFPVTGRLRFDIAASGQVDNPTIKGQLTVVDVVLNDQPVDDLHLDFNLEDMRAAVTGNLNFGVDATCDLRKGDADIKLIFDRTETGPYFSAAGRPDLHGVLTGTVEARGNIRELTRASATVDLKAVHLLLDETPLISAENIGLTLSDQKLSITDFEANVLASGNLRLQGQAHLSGQLDLHIDARIPVVAAKAFSDELASATGTVSLTGSLGGDATRPEVKGRIDLEAVGMQIPGIAQRLQGLTGRIDIASDSIRIATLKGTLGTGSFHLDGTVGHENFIPDRIDLTIMARSLPIEIPDTMAMLVNGDISITGKDRAAEAKGEIILLEGLYYKDMKIGLLQLASNATTRRRTVAPASAPLNIPWFETVNLDLSVSHRQPFEVDNNLAELAISPDLTVGGTLANPIISGRAQVRDGTIIFQKKRFDVQKGVIDFVNPYRTEAEIDVASRTEIRSWIITLSLKGTPDNLNIELTSVPVETEANILSLILFGRTAQELTDGEGGSRQTTAQIMAEMIADTFGDDIKRNTGVDIFQLETTEADDSNDEGGVKVTVGKHLTDRMTVKYAIETKGGETTQRAITEYKLLEHILVSGFQDTTGVYGSELTFRIEFR